MGIIETVSEPGKKGETHYLAHNPVTREDKDATKLRIVFDASAKILGPSLNECLYKGSQLTPLVFDILLRFRVQVIAFAADIEEVSTKLVWIMMAEIKIFMILLAGQYIF